MIKTNLIVARSQNNVIGKDGDIPWKLPADLKRFKELTMGKAMVMGRRTFESLPGLLPGRLHIVVSNTVEAYKSPFIRVVKSLSDARELATSQGYDELWVIGGDRLYQEALPIVSKMYITEVETTIPHTLEDDVAKFIVDIDPERWVITDSEYIDSDSIPFTFDVWKRLT